MWLCRMLGAYAVWRSLTGNGCTILAIWVIALCRPLLRAVFFQHRSLNTDSNFVLAARQIHEQPYRLPESFDSPRILATSSERIRSCCVKPDKNSDHLSVMSQLPIAIARE
jgi:hypothetical protein